MSRHLYSCNHQFFSHINSEASAYWLGFIAADGCVHKKPRVLEISLSSRDRDHLLEFQTALEDNRPLYDFTLKRPRRDGSIVRVSRLIIASKQLLEDLAIHGIAPRKTYTVPWPNLPDEMLCHYLRGYFDGDGSFTTGSPKRPQLAFRLVGNEAFLLGCREFLMQACDLNRVTVFKQPNANIHGLAYSGNGVVQAIIDLMYADATIYLQRKREIVSSFDLPRPRYRLDRTHCLWGHLVSEENTRLDKRGQRTVQICRLCHRLHSRNWRNKQARDR